MRITQECDYAIRIMVMLSGMENGRVIDAAAISEQQKIPSRFTVKILRKLVLADLIASRKGAGGGYSLKDKPENITLLKIVEVIDGPVEVNRCVGDESKCSIDKTACSVHHIMMDINHHITNKLKSISLKDLC